MYQLLARYQVWKWDRAERGATAVEYALMIAAIAVVIAGLVFALGTSVGNKFTDTNDAINP